MTILGGYIWTLTRLGLAIPYHENRNVSQCLLDLVNRTSGIIILMPGIEKYI